MSEALFLDARDPVDILSAADRLRTGDLVVIPTDTVYGLAASIFRPEAVERIYAVKQRNSGIPLPVLVATAADLPLLVREVPSAAWTLIDAFWPGPLTLVLTASLGAPPQVVSAKGTVGVRQPAGRSCLALLQVLGEPVVGTSANRHGEPPALTAREAFDTLGSEVDAVLADDTAVSGKASTVVEVDGDEIFVRREGALAAEEIRRFLRKP
jgi:L-threonylcarbamoyladenylate synthase